MFYVILRKYIIRTCFSKTSEMKNKIKLYLLAALSLCNLSSRSQTIVDSLTEQLSLMTTPSDSIAVLYNIFDCVPYNRQGEVLNRLYDVADRSNNVKVIADVLNHSSNYFTSDSMVSVISKRIEKMPEGDAKNSTRLFHNVRSIGRMARALPEEKRDAILHEYLTKYDNSQNDDIYQRIECLFYLTTYLRSVTEGDLLVNYFKELQTLVDQLPARDLSLKSLFYTQAAMSYMVNGMYEEAVKANKTLLDIIDVLQRQYQSAGRIYRNYNRTQYVCYRRLLRCHEALTPEEIDDYYNRILEIKELDQSIKDDFEQRKIPTIYYLMGKKRYSEVIPLLKAEINNKNNTAEDYRYLVESLLTASETVGDRTALFDALKRSNELLRKRLKVKTYERYKELQVLYEMNNLKEQNSSLVLANHLRDNDKVRQQMLFAGIGLVVLVCVVILMSILYNRMRLLARRVENTNKLLVKEHDALTLAQKELIEARDKAKMSERVKTDFVNNMTHELRTPLETIVEYSGLIADYVKDDEHEYVKEYANLITLNSDLLYTLVTDVLDLPSLENNNLSVNLRPTPIKRICQIAISNIRKHLAPDVKFVYLNEGADDAIINTDAQRVEQVLNHLLSNAAKFTESGTITFGYKLSADRTKVTFTVTDTGIGIPRGQEETIFERFEKVDSHTQGNGLGLYIGRIIAELLKGELKLDADYRDGARFTFTIPA